MNEDQSSYETASHFHKYIDLIAFLGNPRYLELSLNFTSAPEEVF
jgi:hypothetical protein